MRSRVASFWSTRWPAIRRTLSASTRNGGDRARRRGGQRGADDRAVGDAERLEPVERQERDDAEADRAEDVERRVAEAAAARGQVREDPAEREVPVEARHRH